MSWQLQNRSNDRRQIDIYLLGSKKAQVKVIPLRTSVTIPGTAGMEVFDQQTGRKLENPQGKNMYISPEGHIRFV